MPSPSIPSIQLPHVASTSATNLSRRTSRPSSPTPGVTSVSTPNTMATGDRFIGSATPPSGNPETTESAIMSGFPLDLQELLKSTQALISQTNAAFGNGVNLATHPHSTLPFQSHLQETSPSSSMLPVLGQVQGLHDRGESIDAHIQREIARIKKQKKDNMTQAFNLTNPPQRLFRGTSISTLNQTANLPTRRASFSTK